MHVLYIKTTKKIPPAKTSDVINFLNFTDLANINFPYPHFIYIFIILFLESGQILNILSTASS